MILPKNQCVCARCLAQCSGAEQPSRRITLLFVPVCFFNAFPAACFARVIRAARQVGNTAHDAAFLDLLQYFFEGASICHLPCVPSSFSFSASVRTSLAYALLSVKCSHIPRMNCSIPSTFHSLARNAFRSIISLHCVRLVELTFRCGNACTNCLCELHQLLTSQRPRVGKT